VAFRETYYLHDEIVKQVVYSMDVQNRVAKVEPVTPAADDRALIYIASEQTGFKGNVPIVWLRYETGWQYDPGQQVVFRETHYIGDEVVKQSVHVLKLSGLCIGAEQGIVG